MSEGVKFSLMLRECVGRGDRVLALFNIMCVGRGDLLLALINFS